MVWGAIELESADIWASGIIPLGLGGDRLIVPIPGIWVRLEGIVLPL